jgi:hypothetical protein
MTDRGKNYTRVKERFEEKKVWEVAFVNPARQLNTNPDMERTLNKS